MIVATTAMPNTAAQGSARPILSHMPDWRISVRWATLGAATIASFALAGQGQGPTVAMLAAVMTASVIAGVAGFAFSAICGAMLFHLPGDKVQIVQIMMVCSIANQAAIVWALRRSIPWRTLGVFLAGGAAGLPYGICLLLGVDRQLYTAVLGAFLLVYGATMLLRRPAVLSHQSAWLDALAGFLGGITGGAVGFPGAAVTIWCGFKGWSKTEQRAVFQPFILIMQVAAMLAISLVRHSAGSVGFDPAGLLCVPAGLAGTALGLMCFRRLSDRHFGRVVNGLLMVSGLSYLL
jgi:uncharacterized membrane protein YfcA